MADHPLPSSRRGGQQASATDSLHHHLDRNVELTLDRNGSKHGWRDSMSGLARSMLLKAKDGIDTLRGAPDSPTRDGQNIEPQPERPFSSARNSIRSERLYATDELAKVPRASLSLRRVLTSSSRRSKRSPLLVNLMAKRSSSKLQGPEQFTEDASESSSVASAAQTSLQNIRLRDSPRSRASSHASSSAFKPVDRPSREHDASLQPSSPIPIPKSSPPPSINFDIESSQFSPMKMFGFEVSDSPEKSGTSTPDIDTSMRDSMIISRRRSKRQAIKAELGKFKDEHVPHRGSNDHWRMRKASRNKPSRLPEVVDQPPMVPDLPTPMPGTNLPLNDPFDSLPTVTSDDSGIRNLDTSPHANVDGAVDGWQRHSSRSGSSPVSPALRSPSAGHINSATGLWTSNDPLGRSFTLSPSQQYAGLPHWSSEDMALMLQQVTSRISAQESRLNRIEGLPSSKRLQAEVESGRMMIDRLTRLMVDMADALRKKEGFTDGVLGAPTGQSRVDNVPTGLISPPQSRSVSHGSSTNNNASRSASQLASPEISFQSYQSPLEVQDLFLPSDGSEDDDSELPGVGDHLKNMQNVAANGHTSKGTSAPPGTRTASSNVLDPIEETSGPKTRPSAQQLDLTPYPARPSPSLSTFESPDMGSPGEFQRHRADRDKRYWDLFQVKNRQSTGMSAPNDTRTDECESDSSCAVDSRNVSAWFTKAEAIPDWPTESPETFRSPIDSMFSDPSSVGVSPSSEKGMMSNELLSRRKSTGEDIISRSSPVTPRRSESSDLTALPRLPRQASDSSVTQSTPKAQRNLGIDLLQMLRWSPKQIVGSMSPKTPKSNQASPAQGPSLDHPTVLPLRLSQSSVRARPDEQPISPYPSYVGERPELQFSTYGNMLIIDGPEDDEPLSLTHASESWRP